MQKDWAEKYRPSSLKDIVGNEMAVRTIRRWADSWKVRPPRAKALVLRGEPGTGKTSAALALAHDMNWDFIEMNASDQRNAASIKTVAGAGSACQTFSANGDFLSSCQGEQKLIILDEADNLMGNQDRGGAKAIVETIRESGQPIILIVNDYDELTRKSPALKTMTEKAMFRRLSPSEIAIVLRSILNREHIQAPAKLLDNISANAGGDLRAAINDLQMVVEGKTDLVLEDSESMGKRNQDAELQSAMKAMFEAKTVRQARDATLDLDKTPDELVMWVEESIPREIHDPKKLAEAFDMISRSDVYLRRTRALQYYGFWAYARDLMTGGVALKTSSEPTQALHEYRFPGQLIMLSRAKGPRAIRDSLAGKIADHIHTSRRRVKESTLPLLSLLVRNDEELLVALGKQLDLDEADVAYLLGLEMDSLKVTSLMKVIDEGKASSGGDRTASKPASSRRPAGRISRF